MKFVFNFKKRFAPDVEHGIKTQTIRENRKDGKRPRIGDTACLYTGLRTTQTRLLREAPVTACQAIRMDIAERQIIIDGQALTHQEANAFARADGFENLDDMLAWFNKQYMTKVFEGFLTVWDVQKGGA